MEGWDGSDQMELIGWIDGFDSLEGAQYQGFQSLIEPGGFVLGKWIGRVKRI